MSKPSALYLPALIVAGLGVFVGCSSSSNGTSFPDAAKVSTDSGAPSADAKATPEGGSGDSAGDAGGSEVAPIVCQEPLRADFTCKAPAKAPGGTGCSEAALGEFVNKCLTDDPTGKLPSECDAWRVANAACNTCVAAWALEASSGITTKVVPDSNKCYFALFDDKCATAVNCSWSCQDAVCGSCDQEPGTGSSADSSEWDDCTDRAVSSGGVCWTVAAKDADACFKGTNLAACATDELDSWYYAGATIDLPKYRQQTLFFYRGACRDNANWTNAGSAGGDAGVSSDGGVSTDAPTSSDGSALADATTSGD